MAGWPKKFFDFVRRVGRMSLTKEVPLRAAGISYFVFFALIPLLATFASIAVTLQRPGFDFTHALQFLTRWLVPSAITEVEEYFRTLAGHAGRVSVVSLAASAYIIVKLVFWFENSLNAIWSIPPERRVLRMLRKGFWGCLFLMGVVVAGVWLSGRGIVGTLLEMLATWTFFVGFNKILPARRLGWRQVMPGSLLGGTAWYATKWGFTEYLQRTTPEHVYAILGVLPLFLLWIYCSAFVLLLSACVNAALDAPKLQSAED
jgi:membrane protein